jgi:hypothetical protein
MGISGVPLNVMVATGIVLMMVAALYAGQFKGAGVLVGFISIAVIGLGGTMVLDPELLHKYTTGLDPTRSGYGFMGLGIVILMTLLVNQLRTGSEAQ